MKVIVITLLALLAGCTYGTRYLIPVSGAEYKEFDIVDRPDLQSIYVVPSVKNALSGNIIRPSNNESLFRSVALQVIIQTPYVINHKMA